jgi:hypothetical protein
MRSPVSGGREIGMLRARIGAVAAAFLAALLAAAVAYAQEAPPAAKAADKPAATAPARGTAKRGPQKVFELGEIDVVGRIQKPSVFYVIDRGDLTYKSLPLERSLLKEVEDSVNRPPF